jgi:hypothetical protein
MASAGCVRSLDMGSTFIAKTSFPREGDVNCGTWPTVCNRAQPASDKRMAP